MRLTIKNMKQYLFKAFDDIGDEYRRNRFEFKVPSLRVSLTGDCNENCFYCHNEGIPKKSSSIISTGDIINIIYALRGYGLKKIKFTGGEPLLFADLKNLLYKVKHISDISIFITTNGTLIKKRIKDLSPNIIKKISVSLDTLDAGIYKFITGKNMLEDVLAGINILKKDGYGVEIDNLLLKGLNTNKKCLKRIMDYCTGNGFDLQFIELSDKISAPYYLKYHADPIRILQKAGLNFDPERPNDRQFFRVNGVKMTVCRSIKDLNESSNGRCGGLRLLPNGFLKDFFYE
ncbi:radical SAM protein [Candidatus Acidulodesulfobacterium sp. H_13]|uniref:radical SAM protein n=1 Tax=Candidatus Acidulodesulfobacterium sp. H_13 TaxID=3395470 RepID=UPI003AF5D31D